MLIVAKLFCTSLANNHGPVAILYHAEVLVDAVRIGYDRLVGQHQIGMNLITRAGILDYVFLECDIIDVFQNTGVDLVAIVFLCEAVYRRVPGLCLYLNQVDGITFLFNDIRAHKAVLPAEGSFSDIDILITKQFPGDFQGTVIIKYLYVGAFADLIVDLGQVADLVATVGQSLEEVILVVLVGVVLAIIIVIQRCGAEEGLLEGRFGEKSHMLMFGFQSYCFLSVRR